MRKKIRRLSKNKKSLDNKVVKNLKTKRKPRTTGKRTKRTKRTKKSNKKKAGMFSLTKINFDNAYAYLDELLETYRLYEYILNNCHIRTGANDRHGMNLVLDINITDIVGTRHHITDDRYTAKDIIFENDKPLDVRSVANRNLTYEKLIKNLHNFEKYNELLLIVEECLTHLQQNIRNYRILEEAIKKSKIPNIIKTMRTPVSNSIKDGRKNYTTEQLVHSNIALMDYYEGYLSKIKQEKNNKNINNLAFMLKCDEISNMLALPHREFRQISRGFPVGKGGGNLFVEFGGLKHILEFDNQIMINIRDDIQYIIDTYRNFFGENISRQIEKKRNMQEYFRRNSTGYAPVDFNTTRPGGRYRIIQNLHEEGLENAIHDNGLGGMTLDPQQLINTGITHRGQLPPDNNVYYAARTGSESSNQFYDALTGSEQN